MFLCENASADHEDPGAEYLRGRPAPRLSLEPPERREAARVRVVLRARERRRRLRVSSAR